MGGSVSKDSLESHKGLLDALCGPAQVEADKLEQLFKFDAPLSSLPPFEVENSIAEYCGKLLIHNPITHNFQRMLLHYLEVLSQAQSGAAQSVDAAANGSYLLASFIKCIAESAPISCLQSLFDVTPTLPQQVQGLVTLLPLFINRSLLFLCNCQPSEANYMLLLEMLKLLTVCCSTQLYTTNTAAPANTNPILETIMDQTSSASALVTVLLKIITQHQPLPAKAQLYRSEAHSRPGVLQFVRTAAATMFWLPLRTVQWFIRPSSPTDQHSPLSDLAMLVLLVLVHQPSYSPQGANPFKAALQEMQDSHQGDLEGGGSSTAAATAAAGGGRRVVLPYSDLYESLSQQMATEQATLLLYTLLHGSRSFQDYVLARTDVELLLLPVLRQLYGISRRSPNHLYMLQIIVLILSQDASFGASIHRVQLQSVPWYQERVLGPITLGSLVYVVLLRSAMHNFVELSDLYLPTNTLAALANLAPHVAGLHPHGAQRLLGLLVLLARKHSRLLKALQQQVVPEAALEAEVQVITDFLRIVLEVINCILSSGLQRNPELLYAVLHKQESLQGLGQLPQLAQLLANLQVVLDYFNPKLDQAKASTAAAEWTVQHVLALVQSVASSWRADWLQPVPELKFIYEEEARPEEFFVPYVWSLVVANTLVPWNLGAVTLLNPLRTEDSSPGDSAYSVQLGSTTVTPRASDHSELSV